MEITTLFLFMVFYSANAFDVFNPFGGQQKKKSRNNDLSNELSPLNPFKPLKPIIKDNSKATEVKRREVMKKIRGVSSVSDFLRKFPQKKGMNAIVSAHKNRAFLLVRSHSLGADGSKITQEKQVPFAVPTDCQPTPKCRDISFLSAKHNGAIYPACITYPQCGGCCYNNDIHTCVPATFNEVTVNIFVISYDDGAWRYLPYTYKKHTSCRCECKVSKDHCVGGQQYDPYNCHCYCPASAQRNCPKGKQWSNHYCDCVCNNPDKNCPARKEWSKDTCSCVCASKKKCAHGMTWDEASCHCVSPFYNVN